MQKKIVLAEIKLNKAKINLNTLRQKAQRLLTSYPENSPTFLALSLEDARSLL